MSSTEGTQESRGCRKEPQIAEDNFIIINNNNGNVNEWVDEDADDNDDLDGGQDMADEIHAEPDSGSDIDEELEYGGGTNVHAELARQMEAEM